MIGGDMTINAKRCAWCGDDPLYVAYHDNEWGKAVFDDRLLFAQLCLEGMQAGLSWLTILKKRQRYYEVFMGFDADKIAVFNQDDVDRLMMDKGIVRHRAKIEAIIHNAKMYQKVTQHQTFSGYLWGFVRRFGVFPMDNCPQSLADVPSVNYVSEQLSNQLKKDGFKFVGATTCYAFMQAVGMVNDHLVTCQYRHG